jgi:hypothetical protein
MFRSIWTTATGWGQFELARAGAFTLRVLHGTLPCRTLGLPSRSPSPSRARIAGTSVPFRLDREDHAITLRFDDELRLAEGQELTVA